MKNGWKEVSTTNERSVYLSLLDDFCPSNDQNECQFVEADPEDIVHILWVQGEAAGFSTLKPKGCYIEEWMERYTMLTLDTIYVLPQYRRRGFVMSLLTELMRKHDGDHLGLSSPVSDSMFAVLHKFLLSNPQYRNQLWSIQFCGGEGERELIWYLIRRRNLANTAEP
uniref:Soluble lamin-associated protein of 75 kDa n=1 Tax=Cacopsylla melanoneura TaxID=428564 RepID=A0A8D9BCY9_9HEMI